MEGAQARLSLHLSKCHNVGNHLSWLILFLSILEKYKGYNMEMWYAVAQLIEC